MPALDHGEALVPLGELRGAGLFILGVLGIAHTAQTNTAPLVVEGEAVLRDMSVSDDDVTFVLVGSMRVPVVVGDAVARQAIVAIGSGHHSPDILRELD